MAAGTRTTFRFESGLQRTSEAQRDRRPHHDRPPDRGRVTYLGKPWSISWTTSKGPKGRGGEIALVSFKFY